MITKFNLHLIMFHVKCYFRNSKKAFVSVFIYRTRGLQMSEAFAVRKTDDKKTDNKTWKLPPAGPNAGRRCFSWALPRTRRNVRHQYRVTEPRTKFRRDIEPEGNALSPQAFGDPLHVLEADKKTHAHQKDVRAN